MVYIVIIIFLIFFSLHYDVDEKTKGKELCVYGVLVTFICLAGLRWRIGVDTSHEIYYFYHENIPIKNFLKEASIMGYPLWNLLNSFIYSIGGRFFWIQLIQAAFVNILIYKYIKKHSNYIFTCLLFYFIWMYRAYCFEEMKATFGLVLCLFANDYYIEKKYKYSILLYFLGFLFHPSLGLAIVLSVLAVKFSLRFNLAGLLILLFSIVVGFLLKENVEDYLKFFSFDEFISSKLETYTETDYFGVYGKNIIYYSLNFGILLFYSIGSLFYLKRHNRSNRYYQLFQLEPLFLIAIICVLINANIHIFYRFVNIFAIYMILFISQTFVDYAKNNKKELAALKSIIVFLPFFYYVWTTYFGVSGNSYIYHRFYPYSSILDRTVDEKRELVFNRIRIAPPPNHDEY